MDLNPLMFHSLTIYLPYECRFCKMSGKEPILYCILGGGREPILYCILGGGKEPIFLCILSGIAPI